MPASPTFFADAPTDTAIPVQCIDQGSLESALAGLAEPERRFAKAQDFAAKSGSLALLSDPSGALGRVLFGLGETGSPARTPLLPGALARSLPAGNYRLEGDLDDQRLAALAFVLGGYRFDAYRKANGASPMLALSNNLDVNELTAIAAGLYLARDLINTPANDLGPAELADAATSLASDFGAAVKITEGDDLARGFPLIHAVGKASERRPRLIDLTWGEAGARQITLVGKGVVFDTGGLDIKPASAMALMKKDMGGGAAVLGLARMIMASGLPVRLRVLVPAVENAISGRAFRPGDVLPSRKGLTVEIGNTDAEGRLVLADALTLADEDEPDTLICMATLTGAARVALGPDIAPFYTGDDDLAHQIAQASSIEADPVWRLPLWPAYDAWLSSPVADVNHIASNGFAGSIVAALFLNRFVEKTARFAHFDIFGWAPEARPAAPKGGEAQAIRALFHALTEHYSTD
jgi:leucyl aminopeptidase